PTIYRMDAKTRYESKIVKRGSGECWEWIAAVDKDGYGRFFLEGRNVPAHRYGFILANGTISDDMEVCHSCDNPPCQNPNHLFAGTRLDNERDKIAKGRKHSHVGERNPSCLLTVGQVAEIRSR